MNKEFKVHVVSDEGLKKMDLIAYHFDELLNNLNAIWQKNHGLTDAVEEERLTDIVKNKLEEACFYAKKAIATNFKK